MKGQWWSMSTTQARQMLQWCALGGLLAQQCLQ
jgi:hypothetical protein